MSREPADVALAAVLWSLRSYLPELVLIGGWVPRLYRAHGGFTEWRSGLSGTMEVDVLVSPPIETVDGRGLSERNWLSWIESTGNRPEAKSKDV